MLSHLSCSFFEITMMTLEQIFRQSQSHSRKMSFYANPNGRLLSRASLQRMQSPSTIKLIKRIHFGNRFMLLLYREQRPLGAATYRRGLAALFINPRQTQSGVLLKQTTSSSRADELSRCSVNLRLSHSARGSQPIRMRHNL